MIFEVNLFKLKKIQTTQKIHGFKISKQSKSQVQSDRKEVFKKHKAI